MTKPSAVIVGAVLLAAALDLDLAGQSPAGPRVDQPFTSATTAILVDVVVRDRKGRPITDLSAGDFELAEDGVRQTIDSFTRVSRGGGIGVDVAWRSPTKTVAVTPPPAERSAPAADAPMEEATIALVFDHLSPENLGLAQRATLEYVPMNGESSVRLGVFASDPGVRILQSYTTDLALVRKAVAGVLPSGTSAEEQKADRADELIARRRELRGDNAAAIGGGGISGTGPGLARTAAEVGQRETELRLVQTELNMIRAFENMDRDYGGYDAARTLQRVVQTLADYPGRKTIVFFSEGLPVSPALSARLDAVIEAANRANVTTYAVDAHGLRAKSSLNTMRKEMESFAEERMVQIATGSDRTEQPLSMAFERVEDTLRLDSRTGLARLAEETGGFLIEQSNDLSSAFRRIDEDNRFHYLLTYSPANSHFDGKFRAIQVKVRRPGAQVFARKGYRAVRAPAGLTSDNEVPALALFNRKPLPNAFPVRAAGFSFPDPTRPGLTPVLVDVSTGSLRFVEDQKRSTYSAQALIVVRIRDAGGQEVQKVSQQYVLSGELKDVEAARRGTILFYREPTLAPGLYTMETSVFDAHAEHGSVRIATITVPPVEPATLGMSSLVLVNRIEETPGIAAEKPGVGPLYVGSSLLYPNLGHPIRKSAVSELPFYFALYGVQDGARASVQILRQGQSLAEAPMQLPPARGSRVQHVGRLPIAGLPAGTYELKIRVSDGRQEVTRAAFFTVEN